MNANNTISNLSILCAEFFNKKTWEELLNSIIDAGLKTIEVDRGTVFLAMENELQRSRFLSSVVATGVNGRVLKVERDKGVAGFVFQKQEPLIINDVKNDPRFSQEIDRLLNFETKNLICVPLVLPTGEVIGCLEFINKQSGDFGDSDLEVANILALFSAMALEQRYLISDLEDKNKNLVEVKRIKFQKFYDRQFLKTNNPELAHTYLQLDDYAKSDSSILIEGESGTGKEIIAQYVHAQSQRSKGPFVAVNCAAIPESLFEAELFGVAEGAATGTYARKGKLELAHGGTLFLDEVGDLPLELQSKLLRSLQDKMITPIGSEQDPIFSDFRVVAATNRELQDMLKEESFRDDLYYRLNVVNVFLPPLRERMEDLSGICKRILDEFHNSRGWQKKTFTQSVLNLLSNHEWPGNIRELQNRLENACIHSKDREELKTDDFNLGSSKQDPEKRAKVHVVNFDGKSLKQAKDEAEKIVILKALNSSKGNKSEASRKLGISREGLRKAMKKHKVA